MRAEGVLGAPVRALAAVRRWFLAPQPLDGLVAARIGFGATLFAAYALRLPYAQDFFGPGGFAGAGFYARLPFAPPLHPHVTETLTVLRLVDSAPVILVLYGTLLVAALAFALGAFTRTSGSVALVLHLLFWARNPYAYWDWAGFVIAPLAYTVLAPTGRLASLDAWRRRRRGEPSLPRTAPGWPLRLMQIHVCTMYAAASWSRVDKQSWILGEMVLVALTNATHSRFVFDWTAWQPLLRLGTWGALGLEVLAPVLLWVPRLGRLWALGLVALHLGLEAVTNVGYWNVVMISALASFWLPWRRETARPA